MTYKDRNKMLQNNRDRYNRNKKEFIKDKNIRQRKRQIRYKIKLVEEFGGKCSKCGFKGNPIVFQFHHKFGEKKEKGISQLLREGYGWEKIIQEVKKCELICANCHMILHHGKMYEKQNN